MSSAGILAVNEIYTSVQGEGTRSGEPFTFVRLRGCALRCSWCDTAYAFTEGEEQSLAWVAQRVRELGIRNVLLTGGEPLEQAAAFDLARLLLAEGYTVLVETGGHIDVSAAPPELIKILDVKCPGSGMDHRNCWGNLDLIGARDEVKFVLRDRPDFDYACAVIDRHALAGRVAALLFSPVHGILQPQTLAAWLLEAPIEGARLNLQLHKYIWPEARRGV